MWGRRFFMRRAFLQTHHKYAPVFKTGATHAPQLQNFLRNRLPEYSNSRPCHFSVPEGGLERRKSPSDTSEAHLSPVAARSGKEKNTDLFAERAGIFCMTLPTFSGFMAKAAAPLCKAAFVVRVFQKISADLRRLSGSAKKYVFAAAKPLFPKQTRNMSKGIGRKNSRTAVFCVRFAVRATALCGRLFRISAF